MFEDLTENIKEKFADLQFAPEIRQKFEAFLSKMGASTKKTVAVCFSQNLGVEMLEIDNIAGQVTKYATRELAYDVANRKIESYENFANALTELFEEFEISTNSNVVLSLPNIYLGLIDVPSVLHGDAVRNVILSEVEQSYIFKSNEPIVSWHNLTKGKKDKDKQNRLVYTAIQKDVIDGILEACQNVGCQFLTIENSNLSTLRGLSFLGFTQEQVKENEVWQLMIVDANNFSITTMQGNIPIAYFEEPLAMKSFEEDEIYKAISLSANDVINNEKMPSRSLLIVSQTDFVNADRVRDELETNQPTEVLNCNKYSSQVLYQTSYDIPPETAEQITLAAIGTASFVFYRYPISLNYIKENVEELKHIDDQIGNIKVNLGNIELSITKDTIRRLALILAAIMLVPLFSIHMLLDQWFIPKETARAEELAANIEAINKQIENLTASTKQTAFDINTAIKSNVEKNKKLLFRYSILGEIIPKNIWINHSDDLDGKVFISGISSSTRGVYDFYKTFKNVLNNQDLVLKKLQYTTESIENFKTPTGEIPTNVYSFEIASSKEMEKSNSISQYFHIPGYQNSQDPTFEKQSSVVTSSGTPPPKANLKELDIDAEAAKAKDIGKQVNKGLKENKDNNTKKEKAQLLPSNLKSLIEVN